MCYIASDGAIDDSNNGKTTKPKKIKKLVIHIL